MPNVTQQGFPIKLGPTGGGGPSAVTSVFGRVGAVTANAGDYTALKITNTPAGNIAAATVQGALNELDAEKVDSARAILTALGTSGLAGGGDLTADRNLALDIANTNALVGAINDLDEIVINDVSSGTLRKVTRANFIATTPPIFTNQIYVAATGGNDTTGDGSNDKPYQTITKAISVLVGNTIVYIAPGAYVENLIMPAAFALAFIGHDKNSTSIVGKITQNIGGNITFKDLRLENTAAEIIEFGGAVNQSLDLIGCTLNLQAGSTTPLFLASNTAGSAVNASETDFNVADSTGGSKCVVQTALSDTNFNMFKVTVGINDNNDNVCLDFSGVGGGWSHQFGAIGGQMVFAGAASLNFSVMGVSTTSVPNLVTTTAGFVLCGNASFIGGANPCVTGNGNFNYLLAAKFGAGAFAATLNGGAGAIPFPMDGSDNILYNNALSGLVATNVKTAIDELALQSGNVKINVTQAAHGFIDGNSVYQDAAGVWQLGIGDLNNPDQAGEAVVSNATVNTFTATRVGRITVPAHGLTPIGDYFYCDQTTPGLLTTTQPTLGLQVLMGKVVDANTLDIGPVITSLASSMPAQSYMRRNDGTSKGAVNTNVVIYNGALETAGTDITYVPDANNGDSFLINTSGVYTVSATVNSATLVYAAEISVGILQDTLGTSDLRSADYTTDGQQFAMSWTGYIAAGQVVYVLNSDATPANALYNQISIAKVGG